MHRAAAVMYVLLLAAAFHALLHIKGVSLMSLCTDAIYCWLLF